MKIRVISKPAGIARTHGIERGDICEVIDGPFEDSSVMVVGQSGESVQLFRDEFEVIKIEVVKTGGS